MKRVASIFACAIAIAACDANTENAPPAIDGGNGYVPVDAGVVIRCTAALDAECAAAQPPNDCPPSRASDLPGAWCTDHPRAGAILGACHGYAMMVEGVGVDTQLLFMYDPTSGALVALLHAGNNQTPVCIGGPNDFAIPVSCFDDFALSQFDGPGAAAGCGSSDAGLDASADGD